MEMRSPRAAYVTALIFGFLGLGAADNTSRFRLLSGYATTRTLMTPPVRRLILKRSAVVLIGVNRHRVGRDNATR
jgi:hypothetical protein